MSFAIEVTTNTDDIKYIRNCHPVVLTSDLTRIKKFDSESEAMQAASKLQGLTLHSITAVPQDTATGQNAYTIDTVRIDQTRVLSLEGTQAESQEKIIADLRLKVDQLERDKHE